jgi:hypothetical protein
MCGEAQNFVWFVYFVVNAFLSQPSERPRGMLADQRIGIARGFFKDRNRRRIAPISQRDRNVSQKATAL